MNTKHDLDLIKVLKDLFCVTFANQFCKRFFVLYERRRRALAYDNRKEKSKGKAHTGNKSQYTTSFVVQVAITVESFSSFSLTTISLIIQG